MAIVGLRITVGTSPTVLSPNPINRPVGDPMTASIINLGPQVVDLGGADVLTGQGYLLGVGATIDVDLSVNDVLYAITPSATSVICILKLRQ